MVRGSDIPIIKLMAFFSFRKIIQKDERSKYSFAKCAIKVRTVHARAKNHFYSLLGKGMFKQII